MTNVNVLRITGVLAVCTALLGAGPVSLFYIWPTHELQVQHYLCWTMTGIAVISLGFLAAKYVFDNEGLREEPEEHLQLGHLICRAGVIIVGLTLVSFLVARFFIVTDFGKWLSVRLMGFGVIWGFIFIFFGLMKKDQARGILDARVVGI